MKRAALLLSILLSIPAGGCGPPQLGGGERPFKAVDALYTAVSLRDPRLVDQCEQTLLGLKAGGDLPEEPAKALDAIIAEARAGRWEPAQARLGDFMRAQRR